MNRKKKVFDDILYSQCWEDPSIDRIAFGIGPEDVVFSITSGGCNVLTFLLDDPGKVIALDLNPYQNFLLELKIAAFASFTYAELLEFLGVRPSGRRPALYAKLRAQLRDACRAYWDTQQAKIEDGIINCGRYEQYMGLLRTWLQRLLGRELIGQFFSTDDPAARARLYETHWNTMWWKLFTRVLLSRTTMSLLFDKAFFAYLDESFSFGKHFEERAKRALTVLPTRENYFLSYILLGRFYDEDHLPPYLRPESFDIIRQNLGKITVVTDTCEHDLSTVPDSSITKFNFTNIFEWMSPQACEQLLRETYRAAADGALMTYRNLLVPRERPRTLADKIASHHELAQRLHERDLSFIYRKYVVEEIIKRPHHALRGLSETRPSHVEGFSAPAVQRV